MKTCSECTARHMARGKCATHYQAMRRRETGKIKKSPDVTRDYPAISQPWDVDHALRMYAETPPAPWKCGGLFWDALAVKLQRPSPAVYRFFRRLNISAKVTR